MAYAAIALAVVAAANKIFEGYRQGDQYDAAAKTAKQNARLSQQQASAKEDAQRRRMAMQLGSDRAAAAESGFDSSSGSALSLQSQNAAEMELDALTTRYEGTLRAISFQNEASRYKASAKAARASSWINGAMAGVSSYMSGGASGAGASGTTQPAQGQSYSYSYSGSERPYSLRGGG